MAAPLSDDYLEAVDVARDLLRDGADPEYRRGIVNLMAEIWATPEVETGERMEQISNDIGPNGTQPRWEVEA